MTHLGQRLSALIDGELAGSERERVLTHMARCGSCRDEVAALRMLKRRMNALGEAAAGAGLTGRLMGLSELAGLDDSRLAAGMSGRQQVWPPQPPSGGWPQPDSGHGGRDDQRASRMFVAGSLAVFLAGLGTAAFIAGGEPQAQAPPPPVMPSVDVLVVPHDTLTGTTPGDRPAQTSLRPESEWLRPANDSPFLQRRP
jgi:anti-sigma factor RsiW